MAHIYCAGPLFNPAEQEEMAAIAAELEEAGHSTFLPHRDGLEFDQLQPLLIAQGQTLAKASRLLEQAIFALDVHLVLNQTDAVVANLNGRVPDEGMVVEAAIAWHAGKPLVFYKSDVRSLFHGADNPLLHGLTRFSVAKSIPEIPQALERQFELSQGAVKDACQLGAAIQKLRAEHPDKTALAKALVNEMLKE